MNAIAQNDSCRAAAGKIVGKACEVAELVAPIPGLGVAITEAQEQVFQALCYGEKIAAPGPWIGQCYPDDASAIFGMLVAIYEAIPAAQKQLVEATS